MDRLIYAYEFAKKLENTDANVCADYGDGFCEFGYSRSLLRLLLSETQTVDAVEVVRCRECKNMIPQSHTRYCTVWNAVNGMGDDGFCNYGERKDDGSDG